MYQKVTVQRHIFIHFYGIVKKKISFI